MRHVAQVFATGGAAEVVVVTGCSAEAVALRPLGRPPRRRRAAAHRREHDWRLGHVVFRSCRRPGMQQRCPSPSWSAGRPATCSARPTSPPLIRGFLELRRPTPAAAPAVAAHEGRRGASGHHRSRTARPPSNGFGAAGTLRDLLDLGMCGAPAALRLIEAGPECIAPDIDVPDDYTSARSQMDWSEPT